MRRRLIIMGAGGHGRVCAEIAVQSGDFAEVVFSDARAPHAAAEAGFAVPYDDQALAGLDPAAFCAFVGLGQLDTGTERIALFDRLRSLGFCLPVLCSRSAHLAPSARVGEGSLVSHMAVVNTGARIGVNCIINSLALVEHDARVADHVHIATGAVVNGGAVIGQRTLVGSHATVNHGISVCSRVLIGSGAVVVRDITQPGTYVGVPAVRLR